MLEGTDIHEGHSQDWCRKDVLPMQLKQRFAYIALCCVSVLMGVALLISVQAQAPTRAQIAFGSKRDGDYEIYVMAADGKNLRRLTDHLGGDWSPDWFDPAFAYAVTPTGRLRRTWGWLKQNRK